MLGTQECLGAYQATCGEQRVCSLAFAEAHVWCALGVEHCASCVTSSAAPDPLLSLQHMVEELMIQFVIRAQQFSSVCGHAQIVHFTLLCSREIEHMCCTLAQQSGQAVFCFSFLDSGHTMVGLPFFLLGTLHWCATVPGG